MPDFIYSPMSEQERERTFGLDRTTEQPRMFSIADVFPLFSIDRHDIVNDTPVSKGTVAVVKQLTGHIGTMTSSEFFDLAPLAREGVYRQHPMLRTMCQDDLTELKLAPMTASDVRACNEQLGRREQLSNNDVAVLTSVAQSTVPQEGLRKLSRFDHSTGRKAEL